MHAVVLSNLDDLSLKLVLIKEKIILKMYSTLFIQLKKILVFGVCGVMVTTFLRKFVGIGQIVSDDGCRRQVGTLSSRTSAMFAMR